MDYKEVLRYGVDRINLAQCRDLWLAFVNIVTDLRVL